MAPRSQARLFTFWGSTAGGGEGGYFEASGRANLDRVGHAAHVCCDWRVVSSRRAWSLLGPEGVAAVRALQFHVTPSPPASFPTPPRLAVGSDRHRLPAGLAWFGSQVLPPVPQPIQHHGDARSLSVSATEASTSLEGRSIMIFARTVHSPKAIIAPASPNHLRDYAQKPSPIPA